MSFLRHLKHSEINKEMWDACVINSPNGLIYAQSWYLDAMSPGWEALVHRDYRAVMPLTKKRKMSISYLAQPGFSQQLGIIGSMDYDEITPWDFIEKALEKFSFIEINLNFLNRLAESEKRCNLILDLAQPFDKIKTNFRKDLVKKSKVAHLFIESSENYEEVIHSFTKYYGKKIPNLKDRDFKNFSKICLYLQKQSKLFIRKVLSKDKKVLAYALFFMDEKRIYYMMSATTPEGRKYSANAFLLYEVIKEYSGSKYIFDFEGSSIPPIRSFFKKFGPVEQSYPFIRINNLPGIVKIIKK